MINYANKSYSSLLDDYIDHEDVKFLLSQYCYYIGTEPSRVAAIIIASMIYLYFVDGPMWIKGGTQVLMNFLIDTILGNGGTIEYRSPVNRILIEEGKACGVVLENGEEFRSKYIVSNVNAYTTYKYFVDRKDLLSEQLAEKIDNYKSSRSAFMVYLGLPEDLKKYDLHSTTFLFSASKDVENELKKERLQSDMSPFLMTNYTQLDPGVSPEGKSSIVLAEYAEYEDWIGMDSGTYREKKKRTEKIFVDKVSAITGLPLDKAEVCFSATPKTLEFYSGNQWGGLVGAEMTINQSGKQRFNNKSEIDNLFLAGHDTMPGGSVTSSIDSGVISGRLIESGK
jgi:prolycopene isomerase